MATRVTISMLQDRIKQQDEALEELHRKSEKLIRQNELGASFNAGLREENSILREENVALRAALARADKSDWWFYTSIGFFSIALVYAIVKVVF